MNDRYSDPLTLALLGASAGFLDPRGGMQAGFHGAMTGMMAGRDMRRQDMMDKQAQDKLTRELASRQQLSDIIAQQGQSSSPAAIANAIMASGNPDLLQYAAQYRSAMPKVKSTVKGYDENNNPVFHNVLDSGEIASTGVRPAERMSFQNTGQETLGVDPYTGERRMAIQNTMAPGEQARLAQSDRQFGASHGLAQANYALSRDNADFARQRAALEMNPEYQAQRAGMIAGAKENATNQAKTAASLPQTIAQGEDTIRLVDDLLAHPGFGVSVGKTAPLGSLQSFIPGTQAASFDIALKQLKGKQFLEAFESLKGGGQITQIEGEKATQAMSRMEKANSEEEFIKASREFQGIIRNGINRAKLRAGQQQQQSAPASSDGWGELR